MSEKTNRHTDEDRLINLLNGLLDAKEEDRVLEHLRTCEVCESGFQLLASEREHALASPRPRVRGRKVYWHENPSKPKQRQWLAAAAVAAALLLAIILPYRQSQWHDDFWLPVSSESALLRSSQASEGREALGRGLLAYESKNAREAIGYLERATVTETDEVLRQLFLASALTHDRQFERARNILQSIQIDTLPQPWRRYGRWVYYVSLRNSGNTEAADEVLQLLVDEPGEIGSMAQREQQKRR